jgi:hypothetical protein
VGSAHGMPAGAPEIVPVEQALNDQSAWTYNTLAQAEALSMTVGEETLTDINLLNIAVSTNPAHCQVRQESKQSESESGADWEWWFSNGSGGWLSLAVQAKKLNYVTGRYDSVDRDQCELLIRVADEIGFEPIYVFYSAAATSHSPVQVGCRCVLARDVLRYLDSSFPPPLDFDFVWREGMEWSRLVADRSSGENSADAAARALTELNGGTVPAALIARPAPSEVLSANGTLMRPLGAAPRALVFL